MFSFLKKDKKKCEHCKSKNFTHEKKQNLRGSGYYYSCRCKDCGGKFVLLEKDMAS